MKINWKYLLSLATLFVSVLMLARLSSDGQMLNLSRFAPVLSFVDIFAFMPFMFAAAFSVQYLINVEASHAASKSR